MYDIDQVKKISANYLGILKSTERRGKLLYNDPTIIDPNLIPNIPNYHVSSFPRAGL